MGFYSFLQQLQPLWLPMCQDASHQYHFLLTWFLMLWSVDALILLSVLQTVVRLDVMIHLTDKLYVRVCKTCFQYLKKKSTEAWAKYLSSRQKEKGFILQKQPIQKVANCSTWPQILLLTLHFEWMLLFGTVGKIRYWTVLLDCSVVWQTMECSFKLAIIKTSVSVFTVHAPRKS